jgi:hypothetical protein
LSHHLNIFFTYPHYGVKKTDLESIVQIPIIVGSVGSFFTGFLAGATSADNFHSNEILRKEAISDRRFWSLFSGVFYTNYYEYLNTQTRIEYLSTLGTSLFSAYLGVKCGDFIAEKFKRKVLKKKESKEFEERIEEVYSVAKHGKDRWFVGHMLRRLEIYTDNLKTKRTHQEIHHYLDDKLTECKEKTKLCYEIGKLTNNLQYVNDLRVFPLKPIGYKHSDKAKVYMIENDHIRAVSLELHIIPGYVPNPNISNYFLVGLGPVLIEEEIVPYNDVVSTLVRLSDKDKDKYDLIIIPKQDQDNLDLKIQAAISMYKNLRIKFDYSTKTIDFNHLYN